MSSFKIWCLPQVSRKLSQRQQRAEKARHFEKRTSSNSSVLLHKRDVLEKQSLSEVKMGRGSPICERVRKKIVEYFKNNVPQHQISKALQISSYKVHNIIRGFKETGEISVRKGQGRRTLLDACGLRALRRHSMQICRCKLKLDHAKRKPCEHGLEAPSCPVGQGSFKMDRFKVEKSSMVRQVQIWHSCWKSRTPCPPG